MQNENRCFATLPDDARLWVFAAPRALTADESHLLERRVQGFLQGWHAHGSPVVGAAEIRYDRFLLVAADERATGVSGCSIDSLFHTLAAVEHEIGVPLRDPSLVWYRADDGEIRSVPRPEFRALARAGGVGEDTGVFDLTVTTVGALREGMWETELRRSWHGRVFPVAT